jgi:hypothetical protein
MAGNPLQNWLRAPNLRHTRQAAFYVWSFATPPVLGIAGLAALAKPSYALPAIGLGIGIAVKSTQFIGAAIHDDQLHYRNNPFGFVYKVPLSDISEIRMAPAPFAFGATNCAFIRTSSGWDRVLALAVAGDTGLSLRTRDEPEMATGVLAELVRATGLSVEGLVLPDSP